MHACFVNADGDVGLKTNANVTKLLRDSQTFMKTSKNFMVKRIKGMYHSYKQTELII